MSLRKKAKNFFLAADVPLLEEEKQEKPLIFKWLRLFSWSFFVIVLGSLFYYSVQNFWEVVITIDSFVKYISEMLGI
jgi:hypothetical protein